MYENEIGYYESNQQDTERPARREAQHRRSRISRPTTEYKLKEIRSHIDNNNKPTKNKHNKPLEYLSLTP